MIGSVAIYLKVLKGKGGTNSIILEKILPNSLNNCIIYSSFGS